MRRIGTLLVLVFAVLSAPARADDPSLVLRWHLDATAGTDTPDSSGEGYAGTLVNPGVSITGRGRFSGGATFTGGSLIANDAAFVPTTPTVVLWVRHAGAPSASSTWLASGGRAPSSNCGSGPEAAFGLRTLANGNVVFSTRPDPLAFVDSPAAGSLQVWDGLWHQLVGTNDGTRTRLYLDGTQVGAGTATSAVYTFNASPAFALGRVYYGCPGTGTYTGDMDDARLYLRDLSAAEISHLAGSPGNVRPRDLPKPPAPQTGPVARYHLDTGTTVTDSSGNGHDASEASGVDQTDGAFGHALQLQNPGDGFLVPGDPQLEPQELTVSLWMKSGTVLHDQVLVGKGALGCSNQAWGIRTDAQGEPTFYVSLFDGSGTAPTLLTTPPIPKGRVFDDQWHQLAATYRDGVATMYLDGASWRQAALAPSPQGGAEEIDYSRYSQSAALSLGRYASSAGQCSLSGFQYYGALDEVQLFDHVLDAQQIAALGDRSKPTPPAVPAPEPTPNPAAEPEPGLSVKWHLDGLDQGQIPDTSGNHLDGRVDAVVPVDSGRWDHALTGPAGDSLTLVGAGARRSSLLEVKSFSLLAWVKAPSNDPGTIVSYGGVCGSSQPGIRLSGSDNGQPGLAYALLKGGAPASAKLYTAPSLDVWNDNWHAVAATYDGSTMRLWVDGKPAGSLDTPRTYTIGFTGLRIFDHCMDAPQWHGSLDEVRFYRRVLTDDEIKYLQDGSATSPPTLPIPNGPKNLSRPSVSGTPRIGEQLTCVPGTWDGNPTAFKYVWERAPRTVVSDGDPSWLPVDGAAGKKYTLRAADDGFNIRCRETAINQDGQGEAVSGFLRADTDIPTGGGKPEISGLPVRTNVLTCNPGASWQHGPSFAFQWTRDGAVIDGETNKTYRLKQRRKVGSDEVIDPNGDGNRDIGCTVVASNDLGSAGAIASDPVKAVDDVPFNTYGPSVEGVNLLNPLATPLSCNRRFWIDDYVGRGPGYADRFKWFREGTEISGATGPTYTPQAPDLGRTLSCAVAATNPAGTSGYSRGIETLVPLPAGSNAGQLNFVFRNRNDPINMLATTDDYRQKVSQLQKRLLDNELAKVTTACATAEARKNEIQPFPPNVNPFTPVYQQPLLPQQQCYVLNHLRPFIQIAGSDYFYCPPNVPLRFGVFFDCSGFGLGIQPVDAAHAAALPALEAAELEAATPDEVLWDIDNDGHTDIACPGSSPVVRGNFDIGRYSPHAVIVTKDSARTGLYYDLTRTIDFPDTAAVTSGGIVKKGAKRTPIQPMWCRNSLTPPPDPEVGPCTSYGSIGRVRITGNLCPMNVRAISDDSLKGLPDDVQTVISAAADVINRAEAEREKAQPGYSPGDRSLAFTGRQLASAGDRELAATAINTAASLASLNTAQAAAATGGSALDQKLDKVFGPGGTVDKQVSGYKPADAQFALDQIYSASGPMTVNGARIDPSSDLPTLIVPSDAGEAIPGINQMTILNESANAYMAAPQDAARQAANIPINEAKQQFKTIVDDQAGKADRYLKDNIDLSKLGDKLDLGPFKLTGSDAKVELNDDGTATLHAVAKLPGLTNAVAPPSAPDAKAGDPIAIGVDLLGDLSGRIKLQGVSLKVPKAYLVGVQLSDLNLVYNDKGLDVGGKITFPLSGNQGIEISHFRLGSDGEFLGINVSYLSGIGQGIQVAPGVFLTKIGGGFSAKPYEIKGQAAVSAGLPSAGGGCPTVGIDGGVTFHWNPVPLFMQIHGTVVIACIPLANLDFYADDTGWIKAHGDWGLDIPLISLKAQVNGEFVTSPNNIWQLDATGSADFDFFPVSSIGLKGVLSNRGVAACGSIRINAPDPFPGHVTLSGGAAVRFPGGVPPLNYVVLLANFRAFTGCDLGPYAPVHAVRVGRQSTAAQTFTLEKGRRSLSIEGAGAAPHVILTSPSGKRYDYSQATRGTIIDGTLGARLDPEDRTVVLLPYAEGGTWKAEVAPGSPAILRIQSADILPAPKVRARVSGKGANRTLRYAVRRIPGQEVVFVETARSAHKVLRRVKAGGKGRLRYRLAEARSSKRTIEAQVYQDGLPRKRLEVAHYVARNPKLKRPRVRLRRAGSAGTVAWSKVPGAVRYDVRVAYANGRRLVLEPAGKARSLKVPGVGRKAGVKVTVVAYTLTGRTSTGTAKVKSARKHKKHKKKKHRKKKRT